MPTIFTNTVAASTAIPAPAETAVSALDTRVRAALAMFGSLKKNALPIVDRFEFFNQGLQQLPLQDIHGLDPASPEAEIRRNSNRTAVYEYVRDFRFASDGSGDAASLLLKATALARVRETMRDQEGPAAASGTLPTPHAETLAATLDTTVGVLGFIETSFNLTFMQSMMMDDEEFEIEKEW